MTIETQAIKTLRYLKGAGVSYKEFANTVGVNVRNIYYAISKEKNMSTARAAYILWAAEEYYPVQYELIQRQLAMLS